MSTRSLLLNKIGKFLDTQGIDDDDVTVDIPVITDTSATVYITSKSSCVDDIDEIAMYEYLAQVKGLDNLELEIEVIDPSERDDALEGAAQRDSGDADDEEEEDELAADNLNIIEDDEDSYEYSEEDEDYESDEYEEDEESIDGVDDYEPTWEDFEEMTKGYDYD